ncbi:MULTISPECIES: AAA family ATPase [unclassified Bradyrhizobium]|uniref:AAA family ATPase n=1 Tax=Bradyrhizobium sp. USDA 4541 TaxID=2817704 RepID=UPI0020A36206|nr:AAA family ATPase [Bradyrhizobium sp. USDA 4541]MCP1852096.1 putative ATPase [Bradyrhizobium sp. USDA 4541]
MRLLKFRVENFRSVVDSGWIEAEQVTSLIGVNESGKTNLLLPLWKLNPAREGEIKPTSDYPKGNYAAVKAEPSRFFFIHAHFALDDSLTTEIARLTGLNASSVNTVLVAKNFANYIWIGFPNFRAEKTILAAELQGALATAHSEISAISQLAKEGNLKEKLLEAVVNASANASDDAKNTADHIASLSSQLSSIVPESAAPTSSIVPRFKLLLETLASMESRLRVPEPNTIEGVRDLILKNLPKFVFYSNYGNLDSEIYLPHVVENLKRTDLGAREAAKARTLRVLFSFVQLSAEEILELGKDFPQTAGRAPTADEIAAIATKKRERTILLNSAGTQLTKSFRNWWKQGDYTFEFDADGDHFRIWVSDKRRPEKVELEDRSSGLQWFLSFYLVFLVESTGEHKNAVLLLDEPGLSLHPLAQRDLSAFFENLASTNQIIYTTHSPFLVDADMLDRVRKVYVSEDGSTKASPDLRTGFEDPRKSGATYAIYSALNMNVAESLLYGCHPVVVEGPSDQHYLATIKIALIGAKRINPSRELVFPPSHGANNAKVVASILSGKDEVLPVMLLDGDAAGQKMARDLKNGLYQGEKEKILTTDKYVGFADSEIEDLFPVDFLTSVIDRWGRRADVPFSDVVELGKPIVPQIEAWAKSQNVELYEGWKVDIAREAKRKALTPSFSFDETTIEKWGKLFDELLNPPR